MQKQGLAPTWVTASMLTATGIADFIIKLLATYQWNSVFLVRDMLADQWFEDTFTSVGESIRENVNGFQLLSAVLEGVDLKNETAMLLDWIRPISRGKCNACFRQE